MLSTASLGKQIPSSLYLNKSIVSALLVLASQCISVEAQTEGFPTRIEKRDFDPTTFLWYTAPAEKWEDAVAVGNGRLGAMVFGGVDEERILLNEDTYYSGGPYSTVVKGGHKVLPEIQKNIFEGKPVKAHKMFGRHLMGNPVEQQKYQSLANLHLFYKKDQTFKDYKRWLDLATGAAGVSYEADGVTYTREVLASHPDQTIAIRLTASKAGMISFETELRGVRNNTHSNYATDYFRMDGEGENELVLRGKSADYMGIEGKLRYEARVRVEAEGGEITRDDSRIKVSQADAVTIYFVAATNFVSYKDVSEDEERRVRDYFKKLDNRKYKSVRARAVADHQHLFNRVKLHLQDGAASYLPTDERLASAQSKPDPQLAALLYQFGRYVLIASSRPGTQPANLQGIWNDHQNPPWDSKYTANINFQMNYWPVDSANLSELAAPFVQMLEELTDQGSEVAKEHYGADGWVLHQNTDIWRVAAPMDGPTWGTFTGGGAWLTTHLWEHYLYTQDADYLRKVYPTIKGSVEFFMDFLVEHPNGKWLVTNPSSSPENPPKGPGYRYFFDEVSGFEYFTTITYGSTIDMQLLKDLFGYYAEASAILGEDKRFAAKVAAARKRLVPSQIGKDGTLQEWAEDMEQLEDDHRHFSHMYGLFPGNVLSVKRTPELVEPIKRVLEQRGDDGEGFSRAWKMALWARLYDAEHAYAIYKGYIKGSCCMSLFSQCQEKLQVDGTMGVTAAITEMLLQSHEGVIDLLPALPDAWSSGRFDGVCTRGNFELDLTWKDKKVTEVEIISKSGKLCRINAGGKFKVSTNGKSVASKTNKDGSIQFETTKGSLYKVIP